MFFYHSGLTGDPQVCTSGLHRSRHMTICATFLLFPAEKQSKREPICFGDWIQEHIEFEAEQTISITKAVDGVREIYDNLNPAFEKWSGVPFGQAPVE